MVGDDTILAFGAVLVYAGPPLLLRHFLELAMNHILT